MNMKTNHDDYQLYVLYIPTLHFSQPLYMYIYFKMHDIKIYLIGYLCVIKCILISYVHEL
jgi:hypothetical protein